MSSSDYLETAWLNTCRGGGNGVTFTAPAAIFAQLATNATRTAEFRRVISSVPGILAITRLSVTTNGGECLVDWAATTYLGGITAGQTTVNGGA